jgi:uncharacterized repeat protein (TIGR03803 family)
MKRLGLPVLLVLLFIDAPLFPQTLTVLHAFDGSDGASPGPGLLRDGAGNLYGTTQNGSTAGVGAIFKLDTAGHYTGLYSFLGRPSDGAVPTGGCCRTKMDLSSAR